MMRALRAYLQRRRCAAGNHDWQYSTSGMAAYCRADDCDGYWEYD